MRRKMIAALLLVLFLAGCADTVIFLPDDPVEMLAVPLGNTEASTEEPMETQLPEPAVPVETEAARIQTATKAPSSPSKGNGDTGSTVGSVTVTKPTATEPKETKPSATEPKETKPQETKPPATESVQLRPTQPEPTKPKETEPKETQPPATESVVIQVTEPKETKPSATEPKETKPQETKPPATESVQLRPTQPEPTKPKETEPKETQPPVTESVVIQSTDPEETVPVRTEPKETVPPETKPSVTEPPVTEPPATEPPVTEPPVTEPPATEPPITEPPAAEPEIYDISGYTVGNLEYRILDRINEYRTEAGLEELYLDSYLCAVASCRGYEANLVWSHTRPDGRHFATVLDDYGYSAGAVQELLAYATGDSDAMVDKWMSSESHRAILLGDFGTLGVGIYRTNGYTIAACLLID